MPFDYNKMLYVNNKSNIITQYLFSLYPLLILFGCAWLITTESCNEKNNYCNQERNIGTLAIKINH